jgi:16S rRNA (cytosine1402-N4)-methyltransferase
LDRDEAALERARSNLREFGDRVEFAQSSFAELSKVHASLDWPPVQGVLLDLGLSSAQLGDPRRGFSFREEGPLDMRFDRSQGLQASDLVNTSDRQELMRILRDFGEERQSGRIANAIVEARPLRTTLELAELVSTAVGRTGGRIHPATRVFQALRIAVNDELAALQRGLEAAAAVLTHQGRLTVIAFHSLEDRIVKRFFREEEKLRIITKKPIRPSESEVGRNPRSRSARLRVAERM